MIENFWAALCFSIFGNECFGMGLNRGLFPSSIRLSLDSWGIFGGVELYSGLISVRKGSFFLFLGYEHFRGTVVPWGFRSAPSLLHKDIQQ